MVVETPPTTVVEREVERDIGVLVVEAPPTTVVEREVERDVGVLVLVLELPLGVRYQLTSGSPRHSPTVTPFQPFCWIKPK